MSDLLPAFIYPADGSNGQSYTYNYDDTVNVSWSWDGPPGASVFVILWLSASGDEKLSEKRNISFDNPGSGSCLVPLTFDDVQYPAEGHFQLYSGFKNGTVVAGPNTGDAFVAKDTATAMQCRNCTKEASSSITSVSPTGTITSNSATTRFTNSGSLTTSPQSTPSQPTSLGGALSGGQIAGIVIGVIIAVAIAGIFGAFYQRRRTGGKTLHQMATTEGFQGSPQNASQGSPQELHGHHQKTEHGGTELYELNNSDWLPEKDSGNWLPEKDSGN